ncbi:MAG TPA: hypothetical protein VI968_03225 [archaeon]|nr:hypothetical protein [archaeon]
MPKKAAQKPIAWDRPYIQLIVLLLAIAFLIVGAAYFVPSENLAGDLITDGIPVPGARSAGNIAGGAYMDQNSGLITDGVPVPSSYNQADGGNNLVDDTSTQYQNTIQCNDGIDNDNDGLSDLEDSKCMNRWDVSEIY